MDEPTLEVDVVEVEVRSTYWDRKNIYIYIYLNQ